MKRNLLQIFIMVLIFVGFVVPHSIQASFSEDKNEQEDSSRITDGYLTNNKTNFNFIDISDYKNVQYTYEENGKVYLVKENSNEDLSEINTEVYEMNEDSRVLVDSFMTSIQKNYGGIIINMYRDGNLADSTYININNDSAGNGEIALASTGSYDGKVFYDGSTNKFYTAWHYAYDYNGSNTIVKFTYTAIIGILSGISGNPYVTGGVTAAAQFILDQMIPSVYWHRTEYEVHQITYPERMFYGSPIGTRSYVEFYSDSFRTSQVGYDVYEWRDSSRWPNISITE